MRTAVFITPESLLRDRPAKREFDEFPSAPMFQVATRAVTALGRLKEAGFMIIGLGREELFHGFASRSSCQEFLAASTLDDVIIPSPAKPGHPLDAAMIQAAGKWLLDLDRSFFIGRDQGDLDAARLTGCTPVRMETEKGRAEAGLNSVVDSILKMCGQDRGVPILARG